MKTKKLSLLLLVCLILAGTFYSCEKDEESVDATSPVVSVSISEGSEVDPTYSFDVTANDEMKLASVVITLNAEEIENVLEFEDSKSYTNTYDITEAPKGAQVLVVVATDDAGNITTETVNYSVAVAAPEVKFGEILYLPFEDNFTDAVKMEDATVVGEPSFAEGKLGQAYQGAADAYLTVPAVNYIAETAKEITVSFWYQPTPSSNARAGLFVFGPSTWTESDGDDRSRGFRIFHEEFGNATDAKFGANAGWLFPETGQKGDEWLSDDNNPLFVASDNPEWIHIAITMKEGFYKTFVNCEVAKESVGCDENNPDDCSPEMANKLLVPNFSTCDQFTIGSGVPSFTYWDFFSELGKIDELRIFDRALTIDELQLVMNDE